MRHARVIIWLFCKNLLEGQSILTIAHFGHLSRPQPISNLARAKNGLSARENIIFLHRGTRLETVITNEHVPVREQVSDTHQIFRLLYIENQFIRRVRL